MAKPPRAYLWRGDRADHLSGAPWGLLVVGFLFVAMGIAVLFALFGAFK